LYYCIVHILVATPGRVLDLAAKGLAKLEKCTMVVMDEVPFSFFFFLSFSFHFSSKIFIVLNQIKFFFLGR